MTEKGYTHQQATDSLGISLSAIGRWTRAERSPVGGQPAKAGAVPLAEQAETLRLHKENGQLRMGRETLKKAAAFFARENG